MLTFLCLSATLLIAVDSQVFPSFLTRLGGGAVQHGLLLFSMFLLYPLSSVISGTIADRIGKRALIGAGLALCAAPFALSALFPSLTARTLAVALLGIGEGAVESQVSALLSDTHPRRERSIMNLSQMMFSLGAAGGPFLIALLFTLRSGASLAAVLWACTAATMLNCLAFLFFPENRRVTVGSRQGGGTAEGLRALVRNPVLLALAAGLFLYVAAEAGTALWLAKYGELDLGLSAALAPVCLSIFWGGLAVSRLLAGFLSRRVPDMSLLAASMLLTLAGQLFSFLIRRPVASLIGLGITGIGMGAIWPTLVALAGARHKQSSGTAIGIMVASGGLGVAFVQLYVGFLSQPHLLGLRFTLLSLAAFTVAEFLIVRSALIRANAARLHAP